MWKCSKCGKEFKNVNQNHSCVKAASIDEYIAGEPEEKRVPNIKAIVELPYF